jgi:putative hydrolase of the HAD superfamily
MIQYLLFDLDNTLYSARYGLENNVHRRLREFVAHYLGLPPEEAWRQRAERIQDYGTTVEWLRAERGLTDTDRYFAAIHPENEADSLPPDPALRDFLQSIPLPKAILTNSPREHAERVLDKLTLSGVFTHLFDIRENGFRGKPRPEAFYRAFNRLGATPEQVLFIDDIPSYVDGCRALGGRGVLLDENDRSAAYPPPRIRNLRELEGLLTEEGRYGKP